MASDERMSKWRNALTWAALGFVVYGLIMLGGIALFHDGGLAAMLEAGARAPQAALALIVASAVVGRGQRNLPLNGRNVRNFLILSVAGIVLVLLVYGAVGAFAGTASLGVSATVALVLGLALLALAVLSMLTHLAAHARMLPAARAEAILERGRLSIYTWVWLAAMGLTLILLSLAGPGGSLSPTAALVAVVPLIAILVAINFTIWPLLDELMHTTSRETGNAAFYLIVVIGGGWAILAHLGFVPAPAPLDWVTLFTLIMFAASFIATGRRGLLKQS